MATALHVKRGGYGRSKVKAPPAGKPAGPSCSICRHLACGTGTAVCANGHALDATKCQDFRSAAQGISWFGGISGVFDGQSYYR